MANPFVALAAAVVPFAAGVAVGLFVKGTPYRSGSVSIDKFCCRTGLLTVKVIGTVHQIAAEAVGGVTTHPDLPGGGAVYVSGDTSTGFIDIQLPPQSSAVLICVWSIEKEDNKGYCNGSSGSCSSSGGSGQVRSKPRTRKTKLP